ncbi:MAG: hypothetical protein ISS28_01190 [Candidatus Cloacimonetes bacterium]|nr:hypothetical protein [Actinomycetota bacterium]MBL7085703.1 hypothetical protein [Candidatus Cloacimonadota bacterium]
MYKFIVNKKQLEIINRAVHNYMRSETGQFKYAFDNWLRNSNVEKLNKEQQKWIEDLFTDNNGNLNKMFGNTPESQIAYDIHQVCRHQLWKENPNKNNNTVDSSILKFGSEELIKIKKIK